MTPIDSADGSLDTFLVILPQIWCWGCGQKVYREQCLVPVPVIPMKPSHPPSDESFHLKRPPTPANYRPRPPHLPNTGQLCPLAQESCPPSPPHSVDSCGPWLVGGEYPTPGRTHSIPIQGNYSDKSPGYPPAKAPIFLQRPLVF